MTFGCGHLKSPENTAKNGKGTRCRTCHLAKNTARRIADPERERTRIREAQRESRGGLRGHRNNQKTSCPQGHEYTAENTYLFRGDRQCRTCRRGACTTYHQNKRANNGSHTQAEWLALCEEHGGLCLRCGESKPLTRDHVVPVVMGGSNSISNIQPLCRSCNSAKGTARTDYRPKTPVAI